jgi:hypothetical protein
MESALTRTGNIYRVYVGSFATQNELMELVPRADDYGVGNYKNGFMTPANVVYSPFVNISEIRIHRQQHGVLKKLSIQLFQNPMLV